MVPYFRLILLIVWLPQAARQILSWVYWWQVKEYRYDRFNLLFRSTDGRSDLDFAIVALKVAILAASTFVTELGILVLATLLILDFRAIYEIFNRRFRRPVFTQRALLILASSGFLVLIPILVAQFFPKINIFSSLFFAEIFSILGVSMGICWTGIISQRAKKQKIAEAKQKLNQVRPFVIGVTGSYGKTTTKDFIAHLLSQKYKTTKTSESQNTEFGIARNIIDNLYPGTEFFVVELGAYKRGEIKALTKIALPDIGIVTGIEPQHLSLFGSLEEIKRTKFELIEALPKKGVAVFNFSNPDCLELAEWAKKMSKKLEVKSYLLNNGSGKVESADMVSKVLSQDSEGIFFEIRDGIVAKRLFAPLKGAHFVENLTGAILVARILGVSWEQIENGCKTLKHPKKTMELYSLKTGAYIIDDSFNATPKGFEAALEFLAQLKARNKIVITPGIIELGSLSGEIHKKIGRLMKTTTDKIILTQKDELKSVTEGLGEKVGMLTLIENPARLVKKLESLLNQKSVVLLEGRMPASVTDLVERYKNA